MILGWNYFFKGETLLLLLLLLLLLFSISDLEFVSFLLTIFYLFLYLHVFPVTAKSQNHIDILMLFSWTTNLHLSRLTHCYIIAKSQRQLSTFTLFCILLVVVHCHISRDPKVW